MRFSQGLPTVQTDDDLLWLMRVIGDDIQEISFKESVSIVLGRLLQSECKLGGGYYFAGEPYYDAVRLNRQGRCDLNRWVLGCLNVMLPNSLRYNEMLDSYSDHDYCVQHLRRYGGLLCCNDLLVRYDSQMSFDRQELVKKLHLANEPYRFRMFTEGEV